MKYIAILAILVISGIAFYQWGGFGGDAPSQPMPKPDSLAHIRPLQRQLARRIYNIVDSAGNRRDMGIFLTHYPSGCSWGHSADTLFPLASLYKVPMACKVLSEVDSGRLTLDSSIIITFDDLRPSSYLGGIVRRDKPATYTVRQLLEFMLQWSDNCAADKLLQLVGGTQAVEQFIHRHGFPQITIRRTLFQLFADLYQMEIADDPKQWTFSNWERWTSTTNKTDMDEGRAAIHRDLTDKGSPRDLTRLLDYIFQGRMLSQSNTRLLFDLLCNGKRGKARMPGLLPADVAVAHKTGTLRGMVHDMGLIVLPHHRGYLFLTVLLRDTKRTMEADEQISAQIAKAAYMVFAE